jgi:CrcB protein
MIDKLLAVAFGGSIGAVARFLIYHLMERTHEGRFPWASLTVNLTGSLLIGLLWGIFDKFYIPSGVRLFIFIGLLGSFTTYSTFSFDVFSLWKEGEFRTALVYLLGTNIGGIGLAFTGYYLSRLV